MTKELTELLEHTNSVLTTLNKDYEAMQLQKSEVRKDQAETLDELTSNLRRILAEYKPTIIDIANKTGESHIIRESDNIIVHQNEKYVYYYSLSIDWYANNNNEADCRIGFTCYYMSLTTYGIKEILSDTKCHSWARFFVTTDAVSCDKEFNINKLADYVSVMLNHCPDYEQLKIVFEQAVTAYIQDCMERVQIRNERLADNIKEVTK